MNDFFTFLGNNKETLVQLVLEHIGLTLLSLLLACIIAIPLGVFIARKPKAAGLTLGAAGILQTIPSIALLGSLIPILGIGVKPAIFALLIYAILPILRNTYTGITGVDKSITEAAQGMGMTPVQVLQKVELPLALPVVLAGIRTAAVINVGVATLAAYIGAGGLGDFIFKGIALNNGDMILAGALPAALLAIIFDQLLAFLPKVSTKIALGSLLLLAFLTLVIFAWPSTNKSTAATDATTFSAGFDPEFADRADGMPSIIEKYPGLELDYSILNAGLLYEAVANKEVDLISGYSTDGRVKAYDLKVLEDDRHAFPPYQCGIVMNEARARALPLVVACLKNLTGQIDDSTMTALNYAVDHLKKDPKQVATQFLKKGNFLRSQPIPIKDIAPVRIGSKLFTEQYILAEILQILIENQTGIPVELKTGLGGTQICYEALRAGEIDLYPEYSGTGFQVLLEPPADLRAAIFTDANKVYNYVRKQCLSLHGVRWLEPLGFNNTYALMTHQTLAEHNGWQKISDLLK
ncbi:MAG: ABC transporter permease/substrate-binding protein [Bacteroidota bacterium]